MQIHFVILSQFRQRQLVLNSAIKNNEVLNLWMLGKIIKDLKEKQAQEFEKIKNMFVGKTFEGKLIKYITFNNRDFIAHCINEDNYQEELVITKHLIV